MTDNSDKKKESLADLSEEEREAVLKRLDEAAAEGQAIADAAPDLDPDSDDPLRDLLEGRPEQ